MGVLDDMKNGEYPVIDSLESRDQKHDLHMQQISEVEAETLSEVAPDAGNMDAIDFDKIQVDKDGATVYNPDTLSVNFWASIGLPSNVVASYIYAFAKVGTKIYVGGDFTKMGGVITSGIVSYDTSTGIWEALTTGLQGTATCYALCVIGTDLYVGGIFSSAGGVANTPGLAKWNGSAWSALGAGGISALCLATDGTDLYIGGGTGNIQKWNGSSFSSLGSGLNSYALAMVFIGTNLYVGGHFTLAGGVANTAYIAKWDGSAWSALSTGLNNDCTTLSAIGDDLYIGGIFTSPQTRIAKWDGTTFYALAEGRPSAVYSSAVIENMLYVGGDGFAPNGLQQWDGLSWSDVAGANQGGSIRGMAALDNNLYIGGNFTQVNGRPSKNVAVLLTSLQSVLVYLEVSNQSLQDNGSFPNKIETPLVVGGSSTTQDLTLKTTSGVGAAGADMHFLVGNNGATEAMTILNGGNVGVNNTNPGEKLEVTGNAKVSGRFIGDGSVLTGSLQLWAGRTSPTGYLFADGSAVSRATYSTLKDVIMPTVGTFTVTIASPAVVTLASHGLITADQVFLTTTGALPTGLVANTLYYVIKIDANTFNLATTRANARAGTKINTSGSQSGVHTLVFCPYGLGDGSTTFNLPNYNGKVLVGINPSDANFDVLGLTGGSATHTLSAAEMPTHTHIQDAHSHTVFGNLIAQPYASGAARRQLNAATNDDVSSANQTATNQNAGSGNAHNNLQPYGMANYIIKT